MTRMFSLFSVVPFVLPLTKMFDKGHVPEKFLMTKMTEFDYDWK